VFRHVRLVEEDQLPWLSPSKVPPHGAERSQWNNDLTSKAIEHGGPNHHHETFGMVMLCQVLRHARSFAARYCCQNSTREVQE